LRSVGAPSRPLRVVQYEPSGLGGFCHYTYELAEALTRQGCDVTLVTTSNYELDSLPRRFRTMFLFRRSRTKRLLTFLLRRRGVSASEAKSMTDDLADGEAVSRLRALRARLLYLHLALKLLLRRPDVVHFQSTRRGQDLFLVRLLKRLRFRVLCTAHDLLPHGSTSAEEREAHAEIYRLVDRVIVHAQSNRVELTELFGIPADRIAVIPHGSYELFFSKESMSKERARVHVGLPPKARVVLFFGLIKRYKGLEFLLEAFERIERRFPDAVLAIVGDVFRGDPEGFAYYSQLIGEASSRANVLSVPRYVPLGEVGPYLSAADVVVLPYTRTYQSGVLLSAFAAGRPVVVTRTGGLPEIVRDGETGFVVPPRDSESLARAIERLLERPEAAAEMGERALRMAEGEYSWAEIASRTIDLYREVMSRGIAPRRTASTAETSRDAARG
jgi:glycosyltransferase involved in cell wall biosynthesis